MKLDLDRLESGRSALPVAVEIATEAEEFGPAVVRLDGELIVDNVGTRVLLGGRLRGRGRTACDRCLDEFELVWEVPVEIVVLRGPAETEEEDVCLVEQRHGEVDLHEALREMALLALPTRLVPPEDDEGRCTLCGLDFAAAEDETEEEIDPRWEGLP